MLTQCWRFRHIFFHILFSNLVVSPTVNGQDALRASTPEQLAFIYNQVVISEGENKIKYESQFKRIFPSTFADFNRIYGTGLVDPFDGLEVAQPGVLFKVAYDHLQLLTEICTDDTIECPSKLIGLGINGHWDADAVDVLQGIIHEFSIKKPRLFLTVLCSRSSSELQSFWRFYFDGPHPMRSLPSVFGQYQNHFPHVYSTMEEVYNKSLKHSKH